MRPSVRVERGHDPARGRRLLLRVGRAAGRPEPEGPPRHRGWRRGAGGQLRGQGLRRAHADGPRPGAPALSGRDRRHAAHGGVQRGEQGDVRGLQRHDAVRGRAVDRRGVPGGRWAAAHLGNADGDRDAAPPGCPREGRPADHRGGGTDQVPREGGERSREAGRSAGRPDRRRAGVPASTAGRALVGRGAGDRGQAPRALDHHGGGSRPARRGRVDTDPRPRVGASPPRARAQPGPSACRRRPPAPLDRDPARARPATAITGVARRRPHRAGGSPGAPAASGPPRLPHGRAPPPVRRLHACDAVAHDPRGDGRHGDAARGRASAARGGPADDPGSGHHADRHQLHQPPERRRDPARLAVRRLARVVDRRHARHGS